MTRMLYVLLGLVAASAAVLSFDALVALALLCGFTPVLAWLLPLTIDAGAAAGSLAWLGHPPGAARRFGRALALVLLGGSVAGNALSHGLGAYSAVPAWWIVVAVSAVPPAVLGAVVHLAVLTGRGEVTRSESGPVRDGTAPEQAPGGQQLCGRPQDGRVPDTRAEGPQDVRPLAAGAPDTGTPGISTAPGAVQVPDRADALIASGAGRRRLARELDITEHAARELLAEHRNGHHPEGVAR